MYLKSILRQMSLLTAFSFVLHAAPVLAQDCDSTFRPVQAVARSASDASFWVALETSLLSLKQEQADVRNRVWLPQQLLEIRQKSRIDLEDPERTIKYYRGLLVWKMRILEQEIQIRKDKVVFEDYRKKWPASVRVDGFDVALFAHGKSFHAALALTKDVFGQTEPSAEQLATVMHMMSQLRGAKRRLAVMDRTKFEKELLAPLARVFPDISAIRLETLERVVFVEPKEKITCCGSGRCEGCTHPNVVFRDMSKWPGPTHREPEVPSTLPLYLVMDRLKQIFPDENFGRGFWDTAVEIGP